MSSSVGKRRREQQKREKIQGKAERKAARLATEDEQPIGDEESDSATPRSETQLMEELGALQRTFGADKISLEDFEQRRDRIQAELERLL